MSDGFYLGITFLFFIGLAVLVGWGIVVTWKNENPSRLPWEKDD